MPASYGYLGGVIAIVWDEDVEAGTRMAVWRELQPALDLIESKRALFTAEESRIGRLLKSIRISHGPMAVMCIDLSRQWYCQAPAQFLLTPQYLFGGSTAWTASVLLHESAHQELYNTGGWLNAVGLYAERFAMDFQARVGLLLGLFPWQLDWLRNSIHQGA